MENNFKQFIVTAESAETFPYAAAFMEKMAKFTQPESIEFLFINEEANGYTMTLQERVKIYLDKLTASGIKTNHNFRHGNFHNEISEEATNNGCDLIICGAEPVTGFRRFWNGSETYKLTKSAPCCMISVQKEPHNDIRKIVVPIDTSEETRQKLTQAIQLSKLTGATLYMLGIGHRDNESKVRVRAYMNQCCDILDQKSIPYEYEITEGSNPTDVTLHYAEKINADMIIIMAVEEANPLGFIEGSYPEQMILKSPIPVMTVKPREDLKVAEGGL